MLTYTYVPLPLGIDRYWDTPIHLCTHLLHHPNERDRICGDIHHTAQNELLSLTIHHPCLPYGILRYSTLQDDEEFVRRIKICREYARNMRHTTFT